MPSSSTKIVNIPVGDRPLRVFRATIPIQVTVNGVVDSVEIDSTKTVLQGVFQSYSFNALSAGAPVTAQRSTLGSTVLITLDQPLPITSIRLSNSTSLAANFTLAFHRVDGTTVAEKPTAIASIQNRLATLTTEFVDGRFAVQLRDATGNPVGLSTTNITEVNLQSYPTTPRLGILDELASPSSLLPVWQAVGEIGRSVPSAQGQVNAGADLATTLQRYLNAHPELLNTELKLVAESDAPCQFDLNSLTLVPQFVIQRFSADSSQPPTPKQVLRFSGQAAAIQTLQLPRPTQSQIVTATLEISESLRPQTIANSPGNGTSDLPILDVPTGNQGVCVQSKLTAIQPVTLAQAIRVNGLALGVMAIAQNTTLHVAVYPDQEGFPAGKPVAEYDFPTLSVGQPIWAIAAFPQPVVLFAQPYWIALTASKGSAFWLTQPGTGIVNITEDLTQFQLGQGGNALNQLECRYQWLSSPVAANSTSQPSTPASSLQVSVGKQSVQGVLQDGKWRYDLTTLLNQSSAGSSVSVAFSTTSTGSITVYPPRIVFKNPTLIPPLLTN